MLKIKNNVGGGNLKTCTITFDDSAYPGGYAVRYQAVVDNTLTFKLAQTSGVISDVLLNGIIDILNIDYRLTADSLRQLDNFRYDGRYNVYAVPSNVILTLVAETPCFVQGTLISLNTGNVKYVQDITYDDELLVWDFDNRCYASAKPLWIKKLETTSYYYRCEFDNGTVLNLVGSDGKCHRVFSIEDGMFLSATDCVGKTIMTENGAAKLLSCTKVEEQVEYYNIITEYHMNLFADSVLTSCRLNNLYPISDMKFIKEDRDIIPIEAYDGIDSVFYNGLRLSERNIEDVNEINSYVYRLYERMK